MSVPTAGVEGGVEQRVMVEVTVNGVPRRVHVWTKNGETFVSFPADMTEVEATGLVSRGLDLLKPLDVAALFNADTRRRVRRHIDPE